MHGSPTDIALCNTKKYDGKREKTSIEEQSKAVPLTAWRGKICQLSRELESAKAPAVLGGKLSGIVYSHVLPTGSGDDRDGTTSGYRLGRMTRSVPVEKGSKANRQNYTSWGMPGESPFVRRRKIVNSGEFGSVRRYVQNHLPHLDPRSLTDLGFKESGRFYTFMYFKPPSGESPQTRHRHSDYLSFQQQSDIQRDNEPAESRGPATSTGSKTARQRVPEELRRCASVVLIQPANTQVSAGEDASPTDSIVNREGSHGSRLDMAALQQLDSLHLTASPSADTDHLLPVPHPGPGEKTITGKTVVINEGITEERESVLEALAREDRSHEGDERNSSLQAK